MCRSDGSRRYRTQPFRHALRAHVVGLDQRHETLDREALVRPISYRGGCLGRISVSPERARQRPAKLGLSMPPCLCPSRGRPVTSVENHHAGLPDHLRVGFGGFENERTDSVGPPTGEHPFDDFSDVVDARSAWSAQALHDLRVREEVIEMLRIVPNRETKAKSLGVEAVLQFCDVENLARRLPADPPVLAVDCTFRGWVRWFP